MGVIPVFEADWSEYDKGRFRHPILGQIDRVHKESENKTLYQLRGKRNQIQGHFESLAAAKLHAMKKSRPWIEN